MMKLPLLGSSWWLFKFTQLLNGELFIILSVIIYHHANILLILIIYLRLPILDENSIVRLRKQNNNVQDESKYSICFSVIHGCFLPPINNFFFLLLTGISEKLLSRFFSSLSLHCYSCYMKYTVMSFVAKYHYFGTEQGNRWFSKHQWQGWIDS